MQIAYISYIRDLQTRNCPKENVLTGKEFFRVVTGSLPVKGHTVKEYIA